MKGVVLQSSRRGELLAELGHLVEQDARGLFDERLELASGLEDALCLLVDAVGSLVVAVVAALKPWVVSGLGEGVSRSVQWSGRRVTQMWGE